MSHGRNRGYGAALTSGFGASTGDFVMFMDADRQFDIRDLRLLVPFAGEYDIVAGFRMERSDPLHRRVLAEMFNVSVRMLFGVHLRDIDCAFKLFRGDLCAVATDRAGSADQHRDPGQGASPGGKTATGGCASLPPHRR